MSKKVLEYRYFTFKDNEAGSDELSSYDVNAAMKCSSHLMRLWHFSRACPVILGARCLIFGRTLRLLPYFMCANSEGSGETVQMVPMH